MRIIVSLLIKPSHCLQVKSRYVSLVLKILGSRAATMPFGVVFPLSLPYPRHDAILRSF